MLLKRSLSYTLVALLALQPAIVSAGVVVDSNAVAANQAALTKAANGMDVVNIAKPSAKGVSHNKFTELDITAQGLIFNNGRQLSKTELAGYVEANPHLNAGSASIILNEVTSASRSTLQGYAEIAGQAADFILANPNGITCNGCGFINTPRATLTTGTPNFINGSLSGFTVNGGDIEIGNLNADNIERLDILTRAITLNGDLHSKELNIIAGLNDTDYSSLDVTKKNDVATGVAVDAVLLGGMYANSIKLIGTETGVGVNVIGVMSASAGNIDLTGDGDVVVNNQLQASGSVKLTAGNNLTISHNIISQNSDVNLSAGVIENNAIVEANGDLIIVVDAMINNDQLKAKNTFINAVDSIVNNKDIIADSSITINGTSTLTNNVDSQISANQKVLNVNSIVNKGTLLSDSSLVIDAAYSVINRGDIRTNSDDFFLNAGSTINNDNGEIIHAGTGSLIIEANQFSNDKGQLLSNGSVDLKSSLTNNNIGLISADHIQAADVSIVNDGGTFVANDINLSATDLSNNGGELAGLNALIIDVDNLLDNSNGRIETAAKNTQIETEVLSNNNGEIVHLGKGELSLKADKLSGFQGYLGSNGTLTIAGKSSGNTNAIDNSSSEMAAATVSINAESFANDNDGLLSADKISILADKISNKGGEISAVNDLVLSATDSINNSDGLIQTNQIDTTVLAGAKFTNTDGELLHAGTGLLTVAANTVSNGGDIISNGSIAIEADVVDNNKGSLGAENKITIENAALTNMDGSILSAAVELSTKWLSNIRGTIAGLTEMSITTGSHIDNTGGSIQTSQRDFSINTNDYLNNTDGEILHLGVGDFVVTSDGQLTNTGGRLQTGGDLKISSNNHKLLNDATTDNAGVIVAQGNVDIDAIGMSNIGGGVYSLGDSANIAINLGNSDLDSSSGVIAGSGQLTIEANTITNNGGTIWSDNELTLNLYSAAIGGVIAGLNQLNLYTEVDYYNAVGTKLLTTGGLEINTQGDFINEGEISVQKEFSLTATDFINSSSAIISSAQGIDLNLSGDLTNSGRISAVNNLNITVNNIFNSGVIGTGRDLTINGGYLENTNNGLLFAGESLDLWLTKGLRNYYSTVFANNNINIAAAYDADANLWGLTENLENISGEINAYEGNLNIYSENMVNRKEEFEVDFRANEMSAVNIWCTDCTWDTYSWYWEAYFYYEDKIVSDSPEAYLLSGDNMHLVADGEIRNEYSSIAAGNHLLMKGNSISNVGFSGGSKTVYEKWGGRTSNDYFKNVLDELESQALIDGYRIYRSGKQGKWFKTTPHSFSNWSSRRFSESRFPNGLRNLVNHNYEETYNYSSSAVSGSIQAGKSITAHFSEAFDNSNFSENTTPRNSNAATLDASTTKGQKVNVDTEELLNGSATYNNTDTVYVDNEVGKLQQNLKEAFDSLLPEIGNSKYVVYPGSGHRYLVESDPMFTLYSNFISSDYLLNRLNLNPDEVSKRLGDGYYEAQLVRNAAYSAKGQLAYIGFGSELDWMKFLMDSAVNQQDSLNLEFGVALTKEQIAALTDDLVWMVEREVNGEIVLVMELYLAAIDDNELDITGGLISADEVMLSTVRGRINNSGGVSARDLYLESGQALTNRGAIQGTEKLTAIARDDIRNIGGRIQGGNIALISTEGSIINETVIKEKQWGRNWRGEASHIMTDTGHRAGIVAEGALSLSANDDIANSAADVKAGGDAQLVAGGDVSIEAVSTRNRHAITWDDGHMMEDTIKHNHSSVEAGADLRIISAGRVDILGSELKATNDVIINAADELTVVALKDEYHYEFHEEDDGGAFGGSSSLTISKDQVTNVSSVINAGDEISVVANEDIIFKASKTKSGDDTTIVSEAGVVALLSDKDVDSYSYEKESSGALSFSMEGEGHYDETVKHTEIETGGELAIEAAKGIVADFQQVEGETFKQSIDRLSKDKPELKWIKQISQRDDVDWNAIQEAHEQWEYAASGITPAAAAIIVVVVAIATAGAGAAALNGAAATTAGTTTVAGSTVATTVGMGSTVVTATGATVSTTLGGMVANAAVTSLASQAALSLANNKGNLSAVLDDLGSSDTVKNMATAIATAGAGQYVGGTEVVQRMNDFGQTMVRAGTNTFVDTAINGGSFSDNLKDSLITAGVDYGAAQLADGIGELGANYNFEDGGIIKTLLHAGAGCAAAQAKGRECGAGALGAATAEIVSPWLDSNGFDNRIDGYILDGLTAVVGSIAGHEGDELSEVRNSASITDQNNRQLTHGEKKRISELASGDNGKEVRLAAAACALVECSKEYPEDSELYRSFKALEDIGNSPELALERIQLMDQKENYVVSSGNNFLGDGELTTQRNLFEYTFTDLISDNVTLIDNEYEVFTRTGGVLNGLVGTAEMAGGLALTGVSAAGCGFTSGATCLGIIPGTALTAYGYDVGVSGWSTAWNGVNVPTFGGQLIKEQFGVSPDTAELIYGVVGMSPVAMEVALARSAGNVTSSADEFFRLWDGRASDLAALDLPSGGATRGPFVVADKVNVSPTARELIQSAPGQPKRIAEIDMEHIFNGEVKTISNNAGDVIGKRAVGGHYAKSPNIRVTEIVDVPDANGVFKARIQVRDPATGAWVSKRAASDFFPDHWSKRQTQNEIQEAFYNSKPVSNSIWEGVSPSGVKIQGYYKVPDGTAATAWPIHGD